MSERCPGTAGTAALVVGGDLIFCGWENLA